MPRLVVFLFWQTTETNKTHPWAPSCVGWQVSGPHWLLFKDFLLAANVEPLLGNSKQTLPQNESVEKDGRTSLNLSRDTLPFLQRSVLGSWWCAGGE